jgi:hypothetical protein
MIMLLSGRSGANRSVPHLAEGSKFRYGVIINRKGRELYGLSSSTTVQGQVDYVALIQWVNRQVLKRSGQIRAQVTR